MADALSDPARLSSLARFEIADTGPEAAFDGLARIAARLADAPVAMVNFVDETTQHFKARHNLDLPSVPVGMGFCPTMIRQGGELTIPDATRDDRFRDDPAVAGPHAIRACASVPIRDEENRIVGSICVLDVRPREFEEAHLEGLRDVAAQARELLFGRLEEKRRRAEEARFDGAFRHWPEGFAMLEPLRKGDEIVDFRIEFINELGAKLTAGSVEALTGQRLDDAPPGPLREPLRSLYRRVAETGEAEEVEIEFDGGASARYRATRVGDRVAVTFTDITETKREARRVRTLEERFRLAGEAAGVGVWELDLRTGRPWTSAVHDQIFGYPERLTEWNVDRFLEHVHPADRNDVRHTFGLLADGAEGWTFLCRIHPADGGERWIEVRSRRVPIGSHHVIGTVIDVTARIGAEERQRESERRFRTLAEGISPVVWSASPTGDELGGIRWEEFVGAPPSAFRGDGWRTFVHPEDHGRFRGMWRFARSGGPLDGEFRLKVHGAYRWVNLRGAAVRDEDHRVTEWVGILLDVEERRRAESELATTLQNLPVMVWRTDAEGRTLDMSRRWIEFTGQPYEEIRSGGWDYVHPEDIGPLSEEFRQCLTTGEPFDREFRLRHRDGGYRWVITRAVPLRDSDGRIETWLGTCIDVHERRTAQVALAVIDRISEETRPLSEADAIISRSEEILGRSLGTDRCAYATVDPDTDGFEILADYVGPGVASTVGRYSLDLFGARAAAAMRAGNTLVVRDRDAEIEPGEGRETFAALGVAAIVCVPLLKEGRLRAMMAVHSLTPRDWTDAEVAMVREVVERTWSAIERARAEAELRRLNEELELRVEERTSQLERANRELEGFTYSVAHDLRAPLRAMIANARFLEEDYADEMPEAAIALVRRQGESARHLGQLMDDLLELARIGRTRIERAPIDLGALAREEGGERVVAEEGVIAKGDPRLVRLLVRNLVENARKFSPEDTPIQFGRAAGDAFFVRDRGIGFDPRFSHKLFLPFERLVRQEEYPGSGVGLANVKRIAERHGGQAWAVGKPGEGATFYFTLGPEATA